MPHDWLILADDLTGAADSGIPFARRGLTTVVGWGDPPAGQTPAVYAHNCASRELPPSAAAASVCLAIARFLGPHRRLMIKIDSTLRGQPAAQIAAALQIARPGQCLLAVLAPAFPAMGRTTENGKVFVYDEPLEQTQTWQLDHTYASADLIALLQTAGIAGTRVPLAIIRSGPDACREVFAGLAQRPRAVAVCDASTPADMVCIAQAALAGGEDTLLIGSTGLAHALAQTVAPRPAPPVSLDARQGGLLIVVGSLADVSRQAAQRLLESPAVHHVPLDPHILLEHAHAAARKTLARHIIDYLNAGTDALVEITSRATPNLADAPALAEVLAEMLAPAVPHAGGLILTGGATAAAILRCAGTHAIRLLDELEPGIPIGLTLGPSPQPLITKAGAFGTRESLLHAATRLRQLRHKGSFP